MSIVLASTVLLAATVMNVNADSLPFYEPPSPWIPSYSYAFKGASSILREQGEKLLLMNGESPAYRATHVIALVTKDYKSIRDELSGLVRERWGILEEHENETGPIPEPSPQLVRADLSWPILGEELGRLTDNQVPMKTQEYQLTSQGYNDVSSINGRSQVVIRISDGRGLLGLDAAILQITRSDRSREWARSSFHGLIPLPYKEERVSIGVITSTEIALIEELKKQFTGITIRYFVTQSFHFHPEDARLLRLQMELVFQQFKKLGK
ncbi:MAG: hypothetical protein RI101_14515 [Nitrospira sp.]|jgi:hypothetical protein|nr:hypothetical protein [Nitrospira sp.]